MSFQEYTIADAVQVAKVRAWTTNIDQQCCDTRDSNVSLQIPSKISWEEAATFGLPFATAALGLYQKLMPRGGIALTAPWDEGGYKRYVGQPAIVTGGASSVGQFGLLFIVDALIKRF